MPYPVGSEQKLSTEDPRMGKFLSLKHKTKHCSISDGILLSAACQWNIADSHTSFFTKFLKVWLTYSAARSQINPRVYIFKPKNMYFTTFCSSHKRNAMFSTEARKSRRFS